VLHEIVKGNLIMGKTTMTITKREAIFVATNIWDK
jgi:hypothetical protein